MYFCCQQRRTTPLTSPPLRVPCVAMESHFYSGKLLDELAAIGFETDRDEEWIAVIVSTFHEIRDEIHHVTKMDLDVATTKLLLAFRKVDTRLERTYEKNMC